MPLFGGGREGEQRCVREVEEAISRDEATPPRFSNASPDAGNGSLMRLAPIAVRYQDTVQYDSFVANIAQNSSLPAMLGAKSMQAERHWES